MGVEKSEPFSDKESVIEGPEDVLAAHTRIRRFNVPLQDLGFGSPPPCKTNMKFFEASGRWSVFVLTESGSLQDVIQWTRIHCPPASVQVAPGIAPRVARLEFDVLPERLSRLLGTSCVHNLCMFQEGIATVLTRDTPDTVNSFLRALQDPEPDPLQDHKPDKSTLTKRQNQALSLAVAMGYYQVPHHVGLREIATKLDMSVGALSELIRRAEATVIRTHIQTSTEAEWGRARSQVETISRPPT